MKITIMIMMAIGLTNGAGFWQKIFGRKERAVNSHAHIQENDFVRVEQAAEEKASRIGYYELVSRTGRDRSGPFQFCVWKLMEDDRNTEWPVPKKLEFDERKKNSRRDLVTTHDIEEEVKQALDQGKIEYQRVTCEDDRYEKRRTVRVVKVF